MQFTIEVYSWGDFVTFIHKVYEIKSNTGSHPILDQVAADLLSGKLQRRNSKGHPITPWQSTDELRESHLNPAEVDELPIMRLWRLSWVEIIKLGPKLTAAQEYEQFGWKGALQLEAKRICADRKKAGLDTSKTDLSILLAKYAADNNIKAAQGEAPKSGYIRTHVLTKRKVNNPRTIKPK